jgi:hypothetical protein
MTFVRAFVYSWKLCIRLVNIRWLWEPTAFVLTLIRVYSWDMLSLIIPSGILSVIIKKNSNTNTTWQQHPGVAVSTSWHLRGLAFESTSGPRDFREFHQPLNRCCYTTLKQANATFLVQLCLCHITYIYAANKVTLRTQVKQGMISLSCWLSLSSLRQQLLVFAATLTWQDPPTSNSPRHLIYPVRRSWTCNTFNTSHKTLISTIYLQLYKPLNIKSDVFWNVMPCYWADTYQRFGRTCCVHLHGKSLAYRGGFGGFKPPPPRNSEILTKYQKLRNFYYMKWNLLYQITAASRTPD